MTPVKNGWIKRWLGPGIVTAILASYIGWSAVEIKDNIEEKVNAVVVSDSVQKKRMDTMDLRLTKQLYEFRIAIKDVVTEQQKEALRSQFVDSSILGWMEKIDEKIGF